MNLYKCDLAQMCECVKFRHKDLMYFGYRGTYYELVFTEYKYMGSNQFAQAENQQSKIKAVIKSIVCLIGVGYCIGGRLVSSSMSSLVVLYWPSCCHMLSEYKDALKKVNTRDIFFSSARSLSIRSTTSPSLVSATS